MNLPIQTHLVKRNGIYYFRRRIPLDLRPFYTTKLEIVQSLKTKDLRIAEHLARLESVKLDKHFESLRGNQAAPHQDTLTEENIKQLAGAWLAHLLEEDEEVRIIGLDERDYRKIDESLEVVNAGVKKALAMGDISLIEFELQDFCKSHGFHITKGSEAYQRLAYSFLKTSVEANNKLMQRHQGEIIDTPEAPRINPKVNHEVNSKDTFEDLRDYWISQSTTPLSRTSIAEANTMIKKFKSMIGNIKPSEVTKKHVIDLKDKMLEANSAPATINKGRGILAAIFNNAHKNLKIESNPFFGMEKLPVPRGEVEKPYNIDELKTIFNSPVYTQGERPNRFKGEAAYWIPLLALYSGARLNELGQIFIQDIGVEDGVDFFIIKADAKTNRTVKDGNSRKVPIHPEIIKMGFLDYVSKIKHEGHQQLFPELKVTRVNGKLADKWGDWWRRYVRKELGITRVPQPTHGFRHTFIDHARRCKVDTELRRIIEGHAPTTVEFKSYKGLYYPLEPLFEELSKLNYRGLDMSHLFKRPSA